jgi:hypothetical protein
MEISMKLVLAIIGLVLLTLLFSVPVDAQSNKSISIGGHTFTIKLDDNWTANQANVMDYNPTKYFDDERSREKIMTPNIQFESADPVPEGSIDWTGTQALSAFTYKTKQSSESIAKYGLTKYGFVDIRVLKLTKDYIGAYNLSPNGTLSHAINQIGDWKGVTNIIFNGKPAMKCSNDDVRYSFKAIAFIQDNNTVALIVVKIKNIQGMRSQDIIDSMTVV